MRAVRVRLRIFLFFFFQQLFFVSAVAQSLSGDSTVSNRAMAYAVNLYAQSVRDQTLLYNGSEYKAIPHSPKEHPYFENDQWEWGVIEYNGVIYDQVPLLYDVFTDEVILNYYHLQLEYIVLRLAQEKIKRFVMRGHTFIRLSVNSTQSGVTLNGFYDLLYDGSVKVLAKRKKRQYRDLSAGAGGLAYATGLAYADKVSYFMYKDGVYFPVKSRRSVMKILQDRKEKVSRLASENNLSFGNDTGAVIAKLASYYDQP